MRILEMTMNARIFQMSFLSSFLIKRFLASNHMFLLLFTLDKLSILSLGILSVIAVHSPAHVMPLSPLSPFVHLACDSKS